MQESKSKLLNALKTKNRKEKAKLERERAYAALEAYVSLSWPDFKWIPKLGHKMSCVRTQRLVRPDASPLAQNLIIMDSRLERFSDFVSCDRITSGRKVICVRT